MTMYRYGPRPAAVLVCIEEWTDFTLPSTPAIDWNPRVWDSQLSPDWLAETSAAKLAHINTCLKFLFIQKRIPRLATKENALFQKKESRNTSNLAAISALSFRGWTDKMPSSNSRIRAVHTYNSITYTYITVPIPNKNKINHTLHTWPEKICYHRSLA